MVGGPWHFHPLPPPPAAEESDVLEVITYLDELATELQTMREAEQEFAQYHAGPSTIFPRPTF